MAAGEVVAGPVPHSVVQGTPPGAVYCQIASLQSLLLALQP